MNSASRNCCSKNVRVLAIVIAELKLRDVKRQIFGADFVEAANDAAFEDRPEALNRVRVDRADNIFVRTVTNESVLRIFAAQCVIGAQVVSGEQTNFVRDGFADKASQRFAIKVTNNPRNDVALALHGTDDTDL